MASLVMALRKIELNSMDDKQEIERLKALLVEVCVRANIDFPETEQELEMFDQGFKGCLDLYLNLAATLGRGEIDDASIEANRIRRREYQRKFVIEQGHQERYWNTVVAMVAAADVCKSVKPENISGLIEWKREVVKKLKPLFYLRPKR